MTSTSTTGTGPPLIVRLEAVEDGHAALVGGKAANLASLVRAGFRVPDGFCVTTDAYRRIAAGDDVAAGVRAVVDDPDAAGGLRAALLRCPVPDDVAAAVRDAYRELGGGPVAVRSSATAEDLPWASFAGQQDTFLNVIGETDVLDAVRRCWASLWTDRAVGYRGAHDVDHREVALAVVVQRMVPAEVAGVLFTADPISGSRVRFTVDASPGLGEAVVSGMVNPDHVVLDAGDGSVVGRTVGDKRTAVRAAPQGGVVVEESAGDDRECLDAGALAQLVGAGRAAQAHFGAPQDVEWAIDGQGVLWLTQSRPITTLFPIPDGGHDDLRAYLCYSLVWQGVHGPLTPLGLSAFRMVATGMAELGGRSVADAYRGPAVCAEAGGRIMLDLTPALTSAAGRSVLPGLLTMVDDGAARTFTALSGDDRFPLRSTSRRALLRSVARIALRASVPGRVLEAVVRPAAARRRVERVGARYLDRYDRPAAGGLARLAVVENLLRVALPATFPRMVPVAAVGGAMLGVAVKILGDDITQEEGLAVLRGLPHNVTTEMDLALWRLAADLPADAAPLFDDPPALAGRYARRDLPAAFLDAWDAFLEAYGHRCVAEIDVGAVRWSEDPTHVMGVVGNYLRAGPDAPSPERHFADGAAGAEETVRTLVARARARSRAGGAVVRFALGRSRALLGLRESTKFYSVALLDRARRHLHAIGDELAGAGVVDASDDVFHLDLGEIRAALDGTGTDGLRARVAERRAAFAVESRRRQVPKMLLSDGTEPTDRAADDGDGLRGTAASPGTVSGPARVVFDPVGAQLSPGDILVAPSTDPGWTPLFLSAAGVVLETGGVNSHGAVVARECGIPAVVGVGRATTTIADGDTVTVDGTTGVLKVEG